MAISKPHKFFPLESRLKKQGFNLIAGMDEVGRGPLAGPVVSAAVILKDKAKLPGLNDSKKLSAKQRITLFNLILENCLDYSIAAVSHELVDECNVLHATRLANDLCISELSHKPDIAVIDGHDSQILDIPFITVVKGDFHIRSIAAASILAKVVRDAIMYRYAEEFPEYGFEKHVGYGTRLHRSCLAKHGICAIHRKSFQLLKHEDSNMW
jgi:ribonuclease HII